MPHVAQDRATITVGSDAEFSADKYAVEGYLSNGWKGQEIRVVRPNKGQKPFAELYGRHHKAFVYITGASPSWRHTPPSLDRQPGRAMRSRARQNVWVEVGWFWGKLGRDRVLLLVRGDVEIPSDLDGIEHFMYRKSVLELEEKIRRFLQHVSERNQ